MLFLSTDEWINVGISITLLRNFKKRPTKNSYMEKSEYISKQHYEQIRPGQTNCSISITLNYRTSITFNIIYLMLE